MVQGLPFLRPKDGNKWGVLAVLGCIWLKLRVRLPGLSLTSPCLSFLSYKTVERIVMGLSENEACAGLSSRNGTSWVPEMSTIITIISK